MAHFAKISDDNRVLSVEVIDDSILLDDSNVEQESLGIAFLTEIHGWSNWKQTSYNTKEGKHYDENNQESSDQSKSFRKNYASVGFTWDATRNAFYAPKPYDSWILNENTCIWEAPVAYPSDENNQYSWNETDQTWDIIS